MLILHYTGMESAEAALDWLGGLGYEVLSGLAIAPGEPAAERTAGQVRWREAALAVALARTA